MAERIEQIRDEARAAIAAAGGTAELEQLRVALPRPQGRADRHPPRDRRAARRAAGAGRQGGQRGQGRARGAARAPRRRARGRRARGSPRRGSRRRHPARVAAASRWPPAPDHPHPARDRGRHGRPRLPGDGGPRGRARLLQLHRAQPPARATRRGWSRTPSTSRRGSLVALGLEDEVLLRTHTSPMQVRAMEAQPPPIFIIVPGKVYRRDSDATHSPMFHQVEGLAVGEGITLADLQGTLREMLHADLRRPARGADAAALLPVHRAQRRVRRLLLRLRRHRRAARRRALRRSARASAGSRSAAPAWSTRTSSASSRDIGYDPERVQGFAFGMGIERIAMLKHGVPDLRRFFDNDVRDAGAVLR